MRRKRKPPPPIPLTKEDEAAFRRCFQKPRKQRRLPDNHGEGRFALGDKVTWKGSTRNMERTGVIVEVVGIGQYPTVTEAPDEPPIVTYPELNVAHYYREHESYVVAVPLPQEGARPRRFWPRVGCMEKIG